MGLADLGKIGLTKGEIKVYEALLALGECTKTTLAKKSGVAPSNVYDIANRLASKGMVSIVEKNGVAHFSAANPRHILDYLDLRHKEIEEEKAVVNSLLPMILAQTQKRGGVNVEVFNGWDGLKTVFSDMINECVKGDYNYVFGAGRGSSGEAADRFFLKYSKLRESKGILTNIIFNEEVRARRERVEFFLKSKKCNVKFMPFSTPAEILVYKNKACIIILLQEPMVIRMQGQEVAESFKQYFDALWAQARE